MSHVLDIVAKSAVAWSLAIGVVVSIAGCPGSGTFTPAPQLKIVNVQSSSGTADVGEQVTVSWEYENKDLLAQQDVRLYSLFFNVVIAQPFNIPDLNRQSFAFEFKGPVTVEIIATDVDGNTTNFLFDILLNESAFLRMDATAEGSASHPRLGYDGNGDVTVNFTQFVAFFDPPSDANGIVDDLARQIPSLPTDSPFRAFSFSPFENVNFDLRQGVAYRLNSFDDPFLGFTNACVYGGGISYDGEVTSVKTGDGEVQARRDNASFDLIFLCMNFLIGFNAGTADLVDIQLGNLSQGLVVTLAPDSGEGDGRGVFGSSTFQFTGGGVANGLATGSIKAARVGNVITLTNGNLLSSNVFLSSIEWNMPFLFDTDLQNRIDTSGGPL